MNEMIPVKLKTITKKSDEAFKKILNMHTNKPAHDFKDGLYYAMPNDPRGE